MAVGDSICCAGMTTCSIPLWHNSTLLVITTSSPATTHGIRFIAKPEPVRCLFWDPVLLTSLPVTTYHSMLSDNVRRSATAELLMVDREWNILAQTTG